jgi:hypothetical protein
MTCGIPRGRSIQGTPSPTLDKQVGPGVVVQILSAENRQQAHFVQPPAVLLYLLHIFDVL